jgi:hypothetical protein
MVIDAALRRCAGRLASVRHDPKLAAAVPSETLRTWRDWVGQSVHRLSVGKTDLKPRPLTNHRCAEQDRPADRAANPLQSLFTAICDRIAESSPVCMSVRCATGG